MLELVQRLDFWLTIVAIAFAVWLEIDKVRAWWNKRSVKRFEPVQGLRPVARPVPAHMSSQGLAPKRPIIAVPSTATKTVPSPVPAKNDLTYDEAVRQAAAIKVGGKWWMSGKKLYSVVGGNHARFLEIVSEVRGEAAPNDMPAAPKPTPKSPIAGRPYNPQDFHSEEPAA